MEWQHSEPTAWTCNLCGHRPCAQRAPHLVEGSVVTEILNILTRGLTSYVAGPDGASSMAALQLCSLEKENKSLPHRGSFATSGGPPL